MLTPKNVKSLHTLQRSDLLFAHGASNGVLVESFKHLDPASAKSCMTHSARLYLFVTCSAHGVHVPPFLHGMGNLVLEIDTQPETSSRFLKLGPRNKDALEPKIELLRAKGLPRYIKSKPSGTMLLQVAFLKVALLHLANSQEVKRVLQAQGSCK